MLNFTSLILKSSLCHYAATRLSYTKSFGIEKLSCFLPFTAEHVAQQGFYSSLGTGRFPFIAAAKIHRC